MNILLFAVLFFIGTVFGSFYTLATYRIPLNQDITHKNSYCPKCNHKLKFLDLIPVFSYVFLKGRCRYCKTKISPRYFLIEILSGIAFVLLGVVLKIDVYSVNTSVLIEYAIGVSYITFLFLVGGIDKEYHKIDKRVLIYGVIASILSVFYNFYNKIDLNLNRVIIYLVIIIVLILMDINKLKQNKRKDYLIDTCIILFIICLFNYEVFTILTVICTLLIIAFKLLINKIFNKGEKYIKDIPIVFYISISNIIVFLVSVLIY